MATNNLSELAKERTDYSLAWVDFSVEGNKRSDLIPPSFFSLSQYGIEVRGQNPSNVAEVLAANLATSINWQNDTSLPHFVPVVFPNTENNSATIAFALAKSDHPWRFHFALNGAIIAMANQ